MSDKITELTPEMTGTYVVTTQGSQHVWNLDEGWYVREPGRTGHWSMREFPNHRKVHWQHVKRWPKIGQSFYVILSGDTPWHLSSTIRRIERIK